MERKPVESSLLKSVGYSAESKTLEVEFAKGGVYRYFNVPPEKHKEMMAAASIGSYFSKFVKMDHSYEKQEGVKDESSSAKETA